VADTVKWIQSKGALDFVDPEISALAVTASEAISPEDRERTSADLVNALAAAAAFVPICHYNSYYLVASDVIGFAAATSPEAQYQLDLRSVGRAKK
jgi:peptide/nickel transport system substrate-binding protein